MKFAVPDRLEQSVGEPEREDVLRRFLAEEVIDTEDLVFGEPLVHRGVQRDGTVVVGAERLLHDDAGLLHQFRFMQHLEHGHRGHRRHAQVVQHVGLEPRTANSSAHLRGECLGAGTLRHVAQRLGELRRRLGGEDPAGELAAGLDRNRAELLGVEVVERGADDPHRRRQFRHEQMEAGRATVFGGPGRRWHRTAPPRAVADSWPLWPRGPLRVRTHRRSSHLRAK